MLSGHVVSQVCNFDLRFVVVCLTVVMILKLYTDQGKKPVLVNSAVLNPIQGCGQRKPYKIPTGSIAQLLFITFYRLSAV